MLPGTIDLLVGRNRPRRSGPAPRDPERTRERLLQAAFREVYRSGFQSAGLDAILAAAGVTKGALYHHFGSKEALGYAIVEEIIAPDNRGQWLSPLENCEDPIDALIGAVQGLSVQPEAVRGGCPLINLAQEMSPLDAGFRQRLATIFRNWQDGVAAALRDGQKPWKGAPRPGTRSSSWIVDCHGRRLRHACQECPRCESDGSGNQKHRGVAAVFAPAAGNRKRG